MHSSPVIGPHLFEKQKEARRAAHDKPGFAFLMETGTGKTVVVIDEICDLIRAGKAQIAFVFAPRYVCSSWLVENPKWKIQPDNARAQGAIPFFMPNDLREKIVLRRWSTSKVKIDDRPAYYAEMMNETRPQIVVMNYEALSAIRSLRDALVKIVRKKKTYVAADESTCIADPRSNVTRRLTSLADCAEYTRILTGTVATNGAHQVYSQFRFLGKNLLGHTTYSSFIGEFCITRKTPIGQNRFVEKVIGNKNLEDLRHRIGRHAFHVKKTDVADLPAKTYSTRFVDMTDEQRRRYNVVRKRTLAQINSSERISVQGVLQVELRLTQILCGFAVLESGEISAIDSNRVKVLQSIVEEIGSTPFIVFSCFLYNIPDIRQALQAMGKRVIEMHGDIDRLEADTAVQRFENGEGHVFLTTQSKGAMGITLNRATHTVFFSQTLNSRLRLQAEDRNYRIGQTASKIQYWDLLAPGTVNERVVDIHDKQRRFLNDLHRFENAEAAPEPALDQLFSADPTLMARYLFEDDPHA